VIDPAVHIKAADELHDAAKACIDWSLARVGEGDPFVSVRRDDMLALITAATQYGILSEVRKDAERAAAQTAYIQAEAR
jgi:hypothetical protein